MSKIKKMNILKNKIDTTLKKKGLHRHQLSQFINVSDGTLSKMTIGTKPFSDNVKEKILPFLEVSGEEFESWIVADKYQQEVIEKAIDAFKNKENKKVLTLTQNVDKILKEKNLSRTALSKLIKHSQSGLNCAITGKEPLSKNVMDKLSANLGIPKEDLLAWVLADKFSLKILELALKID